MQNDQKVYPVRNNAPLLPPGQRPSLRGRSPFGAEPEPVAAAGSDFRIIPAGFNALLEFLTGFTLFARFTGIPTVKYWLLKS